jgi:hypothetical protein
MYPNYPFTCLRYCPYLGFLIANWKGASWLKTYQILRKKLLHKSGRFSQWSVRAVSPGKYNG